MFPRTPSSSWPLEARPPALGGGQLRTSGGGRGSNWLPAPVARRSAERTDATSLLLTDPGHPPFSFAVRHARRVIGLFCVVPRAFGIVHDALGITPRAFRIVPRACGVIRHAFAIIPRAREFERDARATITRARPRESGASRGAAAVGGQMRILSAWITTKHNPVPSNNRRAEAWKTRPSRCAIPQGGCI